MGANELDLNFNECIHPLVALDVMSAIHMARRLVKRQCHLCIPRTVGKKPYYDAELDKTIRQARKEQVFVERSSCTKKQCQKIVAPVLWLLPVFLRQATASWRTFYSACWSCFPTPNSSCLLSWCYGQVLQPQIKEVLSKRYFFCEKKWCETTYVQ